MSYFIRYVHFSQDSWVMMVSGCHIDTKLRFKHLRERFTQKKTEPRSKKEEKNSHSSRRVRSPAPAPSSR